MVKNSSLWRMGPRFESWWGYIVIILCLNPGHPLIFYHADPVCPIGGNQSKYESFHLFLLSSSLLCTFRNRIVLPYPFQHSSLFKHFAIGRTHFRANLMLVSSMFFKLQKEYIFYNRIILINYR